MSNLYRQTSAKSSNKNCIQILSYYSLHNNEREFYILKRIKRSYITVIPSQNCSNQFSPTLTNLDPETRNYPFKQPFFRLK